jgi:hypothetical protein
MATAAAAAAAAAGQGSLTYFEAPDGSKYQVGWPQQQQQQQQQQAKVVSQCMQ